ncbi:MAG: DUF1513 domain-containing protein [Pseudomonadota bacterium]
MFGRRDLLAGFGATLLPFRAHGARRGTGAEAAFVACCKTPDGRFGAAIISDDLDILQVETLSPRGHDTAISPDSKNAVVFPRRPGRFAVANSGIITHPDYPRRKLNLATIAPSISLIQMEKGDVLETARLPEHLHHLSIRHMAEAGNGSLWFGGQYEGVATDLVPLIGTYRRGEGIRLLDAPDQLYRRMNQYVGSVAVSTDGTRVATTGPRGGIALVWDVAKQVVETATRRSDVCGVSASGKGFAMTDGGGSMTVSDRAWTYPIAFDNHLAAC